jgi:hypothetical protein
MDLLFDPPLHLTINLLGGRLGLKSIIKLDVAPGGGEYIYIYPHSRYRQTDLSQMVLDKTW